MVFRVPICLAILSLSLQAFAQVKILRSDEAPRTQIIATISTFISKIADGDGDGAKAMFAGDPEETELLDAHLDLVRTSASLKRSLPFGSGLFDNVGPASALRNRINDLGRRAICISGTRASISDGEAPLDLGMRLELRDGKWLITHLVGQRAMVHSAVEIARAWAEHNKALEADIRKGKYKTPDELRLAFSEIGDPRNVPLYASPAANYARPVNSPIPWKTPSIEKLMELPGSAMPSEELNHALESIPGLPCFSSTSRLITVMDEEAGLYYAMSWKPPRTLKSIGLFADGALGYAEYSGALPRGLLFSDKRGDIEKRLGSPPLSSTWAMLYSATYPTLGLEITYQPGSGRDPSSTIHHVTLTKPDPTGDQPIQKANISSPRLTFRLIAEAERRNPLSDLVGWGTAAMTGMVIVVAARFFGRVRWRSPAVVLAVLVCLGVGLTVAYLRPGPKRESLPMAGSKSGIYFDIDVMRDAILDERSILHASETIGMNNRLMIAVGLTEEGTTKLKSGTASHLGGKLAIVLDGQVLCTPVIRAGLSDRLVIDLGVDRTDEEVRKVAGRMHAVASSLP